MLSIKTVLCPLDFSALSEPELNLAVRVCRKFQSQLILQHNLVTPPISLSAAWMWEETHVKEEQRLERERERQIQEVLRRLPGELKAEARMTYGPLDETIPALAKSLLADLIIMGTHVRRHPDHISKTERVILHAPCPVLTLREHTSPNLFSADVPQEEARLVVPLDFSEHSIATLEYALKLSQSFPFTIHLLHIEGSWALRDLRPGFALENRLKESEEKLKAMIPEQFLDRVRTEVMAGSAIEEIVARATQLQASLIVMGVHEKGLLSNLLAGATSTGVLHQSPCPVWYVPDRKVEGTSQFVSVGSAKS
ncbi:MAG: universal stress protein [Acidobacteriota bacterium]